MKKAVWISFDLGVKGDYEGLYSWLDIHGARECCGNTALLSVEIKKDVGAELKRSLSKAVQIDKSSRIYIIFLGPEKQMRGRFLFGGRRAAPWVGLAPGQPEEDDVNG